MPIVNNVQTSFGNRRSRMTNSIGIDVVNNIVNKAVEQTKVNILQVKPMKDNSGYTMVAKNNGMSKVLGRQSLSPLDSGLQNKKNKLMF